MFGGRKTEARHRHRRIGVRHVKDGDGSCCLSRRVLAQEFHLAQKLLLAGDVLLAPELCDDADGSSVAVLSTPPLATRRPMRSFMCPSPAPHFGRLTIYYAGKIRENKRSRQNRPRVAFVHQVYSVNRM